jgi:cell division protein FtsN
MATRRKPAKRSNQRGSTLYGVLAGLLLGLAAAAGVAFYVTRAPMPFVDKATRQPDQAPLPEVKNAPDPNAALYGQDGAAGTAPTGPTATAPSSASDVTPGTTPGAASAKPDEKPDELGALIASLPSKQESASALPPPAPPHKPAAGTVAPASHPAPHAGAASAAPASGTYFLQAGAYRVQEDADALKARIIMMGLPASVQRAEVNNMQINRVRVGPFARLDDMNRARSRLSENKIESAVVRQP